MSRLTILHISIIGAIVTIIVGVGIYFTLITGAQDARQKAEATYTADKGVADTKTQHLKELAAAQKAQAAAIADYSVFENQYMPRMYDGATTVTGWLVNDLWKYNGKSFPERFRKAINSYMASERKRNGIVWDNPGVTALPPQGPNPNTIEFGQQGEHLGDVRHFSYPMQVTGPNLSALMRHVKNWPRIANAGVPVVDGVNITGNSPNLTMTYTLTLTLIKKKGEPTPADDPRVGGENGEGAGGGGFGGGGFGGMRSGGPAFGPGGPMGPGAPRMSGPSGMSGPPPQAGGMMSGGGGRPMSGGMMSGGETKMAPGGG